ncbi:MAG: DUF3850 domain-containing protein [Candidatus Saccharimonadales bacterium]
MKIEKKVTQKWFEQIMNGQKTFELRLADWKCEPGDSLVLVEIDESRNPTGRTLERQVGTIVKTKDIDYFTKEEIAEHGYQVISLLEVSK